MTFTSTAPTSVASGQVANDSGTLSSYLFLVFLLRVVITLSRPLLAVERSYPGHSSFNEQSGSSVVSYDFGGRSAAASGPLCRVVVGLLAGRSNRLFINGKRR
jgi:hypothetical protein